MIPIRYPSIALPAEFARLPPAIARATAAAAAAWGLTLAEARRLADATIDRRFRLGYDDVDDTEADTRTVHKWFELIGWEYKDTLKERARRLRVIEGGGQPRKRRRRAPRLRLVVSHG